MLSINDYLSEAGIDKWVAELGCSNAPVPRRNIKAALSFFAREMPRLPLEDAVGFVSAMDLSRPVGEVTLPQGERLLGFRSGSESPFKLFFARRGASPYTSGIDAGGRRAVHFVVRAPVRVLESFTAGAKDTWTRSTARQDASVAPRAVKWFGHDYAFGVFAAGGGKQFVIPDSYSHLLAEQRP